MLTIEKVNKSVSSVRVMLNIFVLPWEFLLPTDGPRIDGHVSNSAAIRRSMLSPGVGVFIAVMNSPGLDAADMAYVVKTLSRLGSLTNQPAIFLIRCRSSSICTLLIKRPKVKEGSVYDCVP